MDTNSHRHPPNHNCGKSVGWYSHKVEPTVLLQVVQLTYIGVIIRSPQIFGHMVHLVCAELRKSFQSTLTQTHTQQIPDSSMVSQAKW